MSSTSDRQHVERRQQEQLLKLVTKGFYNELINYGVPRADIVTIASHLLGHVTAQEGESTTQGERQQRRMYSLDSLDDRWASERRIVFDGEVAGLLALGAAAFSPTTSALGALAIFPARVDGDDAQFLRAPPEEQRGEHPALEIGPHLDGFVDALHAHGRNPPFACCGWTGDGTSPRRGGRRLRWQ